MLPLIIPIVLLQLGLQIFALVDVARREKTKGPKWIWVLVIVFGEILGSVIYFIFGRDE
jgi:bacteriorhodopsin